MSIVLYQGCIHPIKKQWKTESNSKQVTGLRAKQSLKIKYGLYWCKKRKLNAADLWTTQVWTAWVNLYVDFFNSLSYFIMSNWLNVQIRRKLRYGGLTILLRLSAAERVSAPNSGVAQESTQGDYLIVQWLGLSVSLLGALIWSLVRELRSHKPWKSQHKLSSSQYLPTTVNISESLVV